MKQFSSVLRILTAGALLSFSCCAVSPLLPAEQTAALEKVAGEWGYSHAGPPSLQTDGMPEVNSLLGQFLTDLRMKIRADGQVSSVGMGVTAESRAVVMKSNDVAVELRISGTSAPTATMTYDRGTDLLCTRGEFTLKNENGTQKGTVPVYYKRIR